MLNTKGLTLEISSGAEEPVIKVENSNFAVSDKENEIQPWAQPSEGNERPKTPETFKQRLERLSESKRDESSLFESRNLENFKTLVNCSIHSTERSKIARSEIQVLKVENNLDQEYFYQEVPVAVPKSKEKVEEVADQKETKPEKTLEVPQPGFTLVQLKAIRELIQDQGSQFMDEQDLEDSEIEEEEMTQVFMSKQNGSRLHRKELCQFLVRKINSFGGIRILHKMFKEERRVLLDIENPNGLISDEYFRVCVKYIPLLEVVRKANLAQLYETA